MPRALAPWVFCTPQCPRMPPAPRPPRATRPPPRAAGPSPRQSVSRAPRHRRWRRCWRCRRDRRGARAARDGGGGAGRVRRRHKGSHHPWGCPVAAFADTHFVVAKSSVGDTSLVRVGPVKGRQAIEELAAMSGASTTAGQRVARDLVSAANGWKDSHSSS